MFIVAGHGLCTSVMADKSEEAEFIAVKLDFDAVFVRIILVYCPHEENNVILFPAFIKIFLCRLRGLFWQGILYL